MSGPSSAANTSAAQLLSGERVLVCDGAMGTMLHAAGAALDRSLPELNLSDPGLASTIHESYLYAGADIIQTNTFGANRLWIGSAERTAGLPEQPPAPVAGRGVDLPILEPFGFPDELVEAVCTVAGLTD